MTNKRKQLAWISDHPPTLAQTRYLIERDYCIVQIHSPFPQRWQNARSIYKAMLKKCSPSAIVMVLPSSTLGGEFLMLCRNIPIYQAVMEKRGDFWDWTGHWERITGTKYKKETCDIPFAFEDQSYGEI